MHIHMNLQALYTITGLYIRYIFGLIAGDILPRLHYGASLGLINATATVQQFFMLHSINLSTLTWKKTCHKCFAAAMCCQPLFCCCAGAFPAPLRLPVAQLDTSDQRPETSDHRSVVATSVSAPFCLPFACHTRPLVLPTTSIAALIRITFGFASILLNFC